ncbi:hypothetical protein ACKC5O_12500 [Aeromonas schubertii]|uniref:Uncharacterized protein n=1 Tax=Aeromonas schubertii TaxID=652 RepID=A0ABS7V7K4_9GAMM|nr:hypothetical protein [Aeromonas schubertii]MBZ6064926.1 hypothetical protein [Aeromonas schubertii]
MAVSILAMWQFREETSPCPPLYKLDETALEKVPMERNETSTVGRLEFLVWSPTANIQAPYAVNLLHIIGIELADLVGTSPGEQTQQRNPPAVGLLLLSPPDKLATFFRCVSTS